MSNINKKQYEQVTIKLLDQEDWKIVKEISVVSKNQFGVEINIGVIIYHRQITNDYKLTLIQSQIKSKDYLIILSKNYLQMTNLMN